MAQSIFSRGSSKTHAHPDFMHYRHTRTQRAKFLLIKIIKTRFKYAYQGRLSLNKLRQFATLKLFHYESTD